MTVYTTTSHVECRPITCKAVSESGRECPGRVATRCIQRERETLSFHRRANVRKKKREREMGCGVPERISVTGAGRTAFASSTDIGALPTWNTLFACQHIVCLSFTTHHGTQYLQSGVDEGSGRGLVECVDRYTYHRVLPSHPHTLTQFPCST